MVGPLVELPSNAVITRLQFDAQGRLYVAGHLRHDDTSAAERADAFVANYDQSGEPLGQFVITGYDYNHAGGLIILPGDELIIASVVRVYEDDPVSNQSVVTDRFIMLTKFNPKAEIAWMKEFRLTDNYRLGLGGVSVNTAGNIFLTGSADERATLDLQPDRRGYTAPVGIDVFIAKLDAQGQQVWADVFGGVMIDIVRDIALTREYTVFVTGSTSDLIGEQDYEGGMRGSIDAFLASYDAEGKRRWIKQFGKGRGYSGEALATGSPGWVVVVGAGNGDLGGEHLGASDAFIVMYDAEGNQLWADRLGTEHFDGAFAVTVDADDSIYVSGYLDLGTSPQTTADISNLISSRQPISGRQVFLAKYQPDGVRVWLQTFESPVVAPE